MKITIEIDQEESGPELYYRTLAEMLGRHAAELVSLGNMDVGLVASIYRNIAAEIDAGRLNMGNLSKDEGAAAIKEGFLNGLGHVEIVEANEWTDRRNRKDTSTASNARKFWEKVEKIPEVKKINERDEMLPRKIEGIPIDVLAQTAAVKLDALNKTMRRAVEKINVLAAEFEITVVDDRTAFLCDHEGYIGIEGKWGIEPDIEGKPVVGWIDIFDLDFSYNLELIVKKSVISRNKTAYQTIWNAVDILPEFARSEELCEIRDDLEIFDQIEAFEAWVQGELEEGLPRIVVDTKIKTDFPLMAPYTYHFINDIEFMFPGREVVRKKTGGRLTFWWKDA